MVLVQLNHLQLSMKIISLVLHRYIKSNITKHIVPKLFYPHELQKNEEINVLQIKSCGNLADLFTKSLPTSVFQKLVHEIGMRRLRDLPESGETSPKC